MADNMGTIRSGISRKTGKPYSFVVDDNDNRLCNLPIHRNGTPFYENDTQLPLETRYVERVHEEKPTDTHGLYISQEMRAVTVPVVSNGMQKSVQDAIEAGALRQSGFNKTEFDGHLENDVNPGDKAYCEAQVAANTPRVLVANDSKISALQATGEERRDIFAGCSNYTPARTVMESYQRAQELIQAEYGQPDPEISEKIKNREAFEKDFDAKYADKAKTSYGIDVGMKESKGVEQAAVGRVNDGIANSINQVMGTDIKAPKRVEPTVEITKLVTLPNGKTVDIAKYDPVGYEALGKIGQDQCAMLNIPAVKGKNGTEYPARTIAASPSGETVHSKNGKDYMQLDTVEMSGQYASGTVTSLPSALKELKEAREAAKQGEAETKAPAPAPAQAPKTPTTLHSAEADDPRYDRDSGTYTTESGKLMYGDNGKPIGYDPMQDNRDKVSSAKPKASRFKTDIGGPNLSDDSQMSFDDYDF